MVTRVRAGGAGGGRRRRSAISRPASLWRWWIAHKRRARLRTPPRARAGPAGGRRHERSEARRCSPTGDPTRAADPATGRCSAAALRVSAGLIWLASGEPLVAAGFGAGALAWRCAARLRCCARAPRAPVPRVRRARLVGDPGGDRAARRRRRDHRPRRPAGLRQRRASSAGSASAPRRRGCRSTARRSSGSSSAARAAWRDGDGGAEALEGAGGRWRAAGRAQRPRRGLPGLDASPRRRRRPRRRSRRRRSPASSAALLGDAGIQAAVVAPDGAILAANAGFAAARGRRRRGRGRRAATSSRASARTSRTASTMRARAARARRCGWSTCRSPIPTRAADPDPAQTPVADAAGRGRARGWRRREPRRHPADRGAARAAAARPGDDRPRRPLPVRQRGVPARRRARGRGSPRRIPPTWSIREDKGALADAVRRYAQGAPTAGDIAVRLRAAPERAGLAEPRRGARAGRGGGAAQPQGFDRGDPAQAPDRAGDQDAGGRPARRRGRARLQQRADRDHRLLRPDAAAPHAGRQRLRRHPADQGQLQPRRQPDPPAARVLAPADAAPAGAAAARRGLRGLADAQAAARRADHAGGRPRPRPRPGARRSDASSSR